MTDEKTTTITVSENTWKRLNSLKNLGESFDQLLKRLLDIIEEEV